MFFKRLALPIMSLVMIIAATSAPASADTSLSNAAGTTAPKKVHLNSSNSRDITRTASGRTELEAFAKSIESNTDLQGEFNTQAAKARAGEYSVLEVDVAQLLPNPQCKREKETLIVRSAAVPGVTYMEGSPDPAESGPCLVTVAMGDMGEDLNIQDDPNAGKASRIAVAPAIEEYSQYCAARKYVTGGWHMPCYKKFVLKNDGNPTWNYYAIESWNSCNSDGGYYWLKSCGKGHEVISAGASWHDYAPQDSSPNLNCRTIDLSIAINTFGLGGSYTHCEEQRVYLYPEGGKMSTYWKGLVRDSLRTTRHRSSIKQGQSLPRPTWDNWFNVEICMYPNGC